MQMQTGILTLWRCSGGRREGRLRACGVLNRNRLGHWLHHQGARRPEDRLRRVGDDLQNAA